MASSSNSDSTGQGGEQEFIAERILNRRLIRGHLEYLVKWKGYEDDDISWEPAENLDFASSKEMEEFQRRVDREDREMELRSEAAEKRRNNKAEAEEGPVAGPSTASSPANLDELHPLFNPVILANLFRVCPHDLLSKCRLVCKTWYEGSMLQWCSTSTFAFSYSRNTGQICWRTKNPMDYDSDGGIIDDENDNDGAAPTTMLHEFLDICEQEDKFKPFRRFHLKYWPFLSDSPSVRRLQNRFWNVVVGENVTFLKLSYCIFSDADEFRNIIFQTCPSLRDLILDRCRCSFESRLSQAQAIPTRYEEPICGEQLMLKSLSLINSGSNLQLPISYMELLAHFPLLETLNISLKYEVHVDNLLLLLSAIKMIRRRDKRKLPLKRFHLDPGGFTLTAGIEEAKAHEIFSLFKELKLDLEYLVIDISSELAVLHDLIQSTGGSIRKIKAVTGVSRHELIGSRALHPNAENQRPFRFPFDVELSNLQTLIISSAFSEDLEFLQWMPNLEKLHLSHNGVQEFDEKTTKIVYNTSDSGMTGNAELLKLKELFLGYVVTLGDLRKLYKWMPNVEILSMSLDDDQFRSICEGWRNLNHLHQLGGTDLHDKGVTGMGWEDGDQNIRPNITMLKALFCFRYAKTTCKLTDLSVNNGFLKLPNLQILDISSYNDLISDDAVKYLHEKIPNCRVRNAVFKEPLGRDKKRFRGIKCGHFDDRQN